MRPIQTLAIALLLPAAGAGADELLPRSAAEATSRPTVGARYEYRTRGGRRLRMTLREAGPERWVWDLATLTAGGAVPGAVIVEDAERRLIRYEDPGRGATRFVPHNCARMLGYCAYTVIAPDGTERAESRIGTLEDGIWTYSLWRGEDAEPTGLGRICYDADLVSLWEEFTPLDGGGGYLIERADNDCPIE